MGEEMLKPENLMESRIPSSIDFSHLTISEWNCLDLLT
jgi:hypothetical protein